MATEKFGTLSEIPMNYEGLQDFLFELERIYGDGN